jgi:hypothetical protein
VSEGVHKVKPCSGRLLAGLAPGVGRGQWSVGPIPEVGARTCLHVRPGRLAMLECRFNNNAPPKVRIAHLNVHCAVGRLDRSWFITTCLLGLWGVRLARVCVTGVLFAFTHIDLTTTNYVLVHNPCILFCQYPWAVI